MFRLLISAISLSSLIRRGISTVVLPACVTPSSGRATSTVRWHRWKVDECQLAPTPSTRHADSLRSAGGTSCLALLRRPVCRPHGSATSEARQVSTCCSCFLPEAQCPGVACEFAIPRGNSQELGEASWRPTQWLITTPPMDGVSTCALVQVRAVHFTHATLIETLKINQRHVMH